MNLTKRTQHFTAIIERDGDGYVSLCPELDIASQGDSVEEAKRNLVEALELFFEVASPSEIQTRLRTEVFITNKLDLNKTQSGSWKPYEISGCFYV